MAQLVRPLGQPMPDGHAAIEDKAFALPGAVFLRDLFQVFQDATLQVIDILDPLADQEIGGFLASNAAGAEHCDPLVVKTVLVRLPPGREVAEAFGFGIDSPFEGANGDLVIVPRVDHRHIGRLDQGVPICRVDVMPDPRARIDIRLPHGDDLFLQAHLHPTEGLILRAAFLPLQVGTAGQGADMRQNRVDACAGSGNRAIDPLTGQQKGTGHALGQAQVFQRALQGRRILETGKVVKRSDRVHGLRSTPAPAPRQGTGRRGPSPAAGSDRPACPGGCAGSRGSRGRLPDHRRPFHRSA